MESASQSVVFSADCEHPGSIPPSHPPSTPPYVRRRPETTVLYQVVQEHAETLFAESSSRSAHGFGYPSHVREAFARYLDCGVLSKGFLRVHCPVCGKDELCAFSCKGTAICPSCIGRRMSDTAAFLVDERLPNVGYRQWVFSFPWRMRLLLARDPQFLSAVFRICIRKVFLHQRRRARMLGHEEGQGAALLFVQRFGSLLNLNPHGHGVFADGVFVETENKGLSFVPLPEPSAADMEGVGLSIAGAVLKLWHKHQAEQAFVDDESDVMAHLSSDALSAGIQSPKVFTEPRRTKATSILIETELGKFSFDAGTVAHKDDRAGLERLLRYGGRPPFSHKRLSFSSSGKVVYKLKRSYYTGQTEVVLEPVAFLRRLAALVPPRRQNSIRYYGLLSSQAADKEKFVAMRSAENLAAAKGRGLDAKAEVELPGLDADQEDSSSSTAGYRRSWAVLLKRVFSHDVLVCPHCEGEREIISAVQKRDAVDKILRHLGLPTEIPSMAPARAPPQMEFWDDF